MEEKLNLQTGAVAQNLGVSQPTIRRYARRLGIDDLAGFQAKDIERIKTALAGKKDLDDLTIGQLAKHMNMNQGTLRSHIEIHKLGKKNRKGNLILSKEDIEKIQEFYSGRRVVKKKEGLADLVRKSDYLVYVPGIKQLSGFSEVEKIREFVQNSLLTTQIVVFKKVPSRIEVKLEME